MKWPFLTWLLVLLGYGEGAPKNAGMDRLDLANSLQDKPIGNPLHFGDDELKLLQNYLKSTDKVEQDPEAMKWEQVLLYLFAMHDYDNSKKLDGLELLALLSDVVSQNSNWRPSSEAVSLVVDEVLEKQDLNHDGLLDPSELLTPPSDVAAPESKQKIQPDEVPSIVLQPPHVAHPNVSKNPSSQQLDQGVPAGEGGTEQGHQRSIVQVNVGEKSIDSQNPPPAEHEEPAVSEDNTQPEDHENVEYEQVEVEIQLDQSDEPNHAAVVSDHEM
ncbi:cell growth regulator with EF hand domain protein 1 [Lissotriton helveticus]